MQRRPRVRRTPKLSGRRGPDSGRRALNIPSEMYLRAARNQGWRDFCVGRRGQCKNRDKTPFRSNALFDGPVWRDPLQIDTFKLQRPAGRPVGMASGSIASILSSRDQLRNSAQCPEYVRIRMRLRPSAACAPSPEPGTECTKGPQGPPLACSTRHVHGFHLLESVAPAGLPES